MTRYLLFFGVFIALCEFCPAQTLYKITECDGVLSVEEFSSEDTAFTFHSRILVGPDSIYLQSLGRLVSLEYDQMSAVRTSYNSYGLVILQFYEFLSGQNNANRVLIYDFDEKEAFQLAKDVQVVARFDQRMFYYTAGGQFFINESKDQVVNANHTDVGHWAFFDDFFFMVFNHLNPLTFDIDSAKVVGLSVGDSSFALIDPKQKRWSKKFGFKNIVGGFEIFPVYLEDLFLNAGRSRISLQKTGPFTVARYFINPSQGFKNYYLDGTLFVSFSMSTKEPGEPFLIRDNNFSGEVRISHDQVSVCSLDGIKLFTEKSASKYVVCD